MALSLLYLGLCRLLRLVISWRRSESDNEVEIMVLRHQVRILERQLHGRIRHRPADRAVLAALSRWLPRSRWQIFLVTPDTLVRWHRELSRRRRRRWRTRRGPGRPPMSDGLIELIVRLGRENRRWGCVRIQGELRKRSASRPARCAGSYAAMVSDLCHGRGPPGPSSCVPRPTGCSPWISSLWTPSG